MSSIRPSSVEPLSRAAWDRVEEQVFARLDRGEHLQPSPTAPRAPRGGRVWAVAGVFAAAASLLLWSRGTPSGTSEPQAAGTVPAAAVALEQKLSLSSGDTSRQAALAGAALVLAPHSTALASGSEESGWRVRLDGGQIDFAVEPRAGRPPFVVHAGDAEVSVVGTRFTVRRIGSSASVSVTEGRVKVAAGESQVLLGPGESWPSAPAALDSPPQREPKAATEGASSAAAEAQRRFQRAVRLESTNPETALSIYRRLSRGAGPWAANALFAQARLELDLGRPRRAEPLLREYLRRHPGGVNVKDARELLEQAAPAGASPGEQAPAPR